MCRGKGITTMARIDCSTVLGFAQEADRVCNMHKKCDDCPFSGKKKCPMAVLEYDKPDVQAIVDSLQKWSDEHLVKTRLEDLNEKYPNYRFYENDECPDIRPSAFGYCDNCLYCRNSKQTLRYCWDEPVNGGATGKAVE